MTDRIAGAPISWGVCEVPGWGYQLSPERVLAEMRDVGLVATELGPEGFLPVGPGRHGRRRWAGTTCTPSAASRRCCCTGPTTTRCPRWRAAQAYAATGSDTLVLSAVTGLDGYDERPALDETGWRTLLSNLDRLAALAAEHGVRAVLHPHVGTMVQNPDEVQRVLDGSQIALCLDTGHLLIGGTDPAELTRQAPERIAHTHMKDVDAGMARQVQDGRRTYTEAVREGMYRPLGTRRRGLRGDRPIPAPAGLPGLVRAGAGHDPDRGAARRGPAGRRADQRGVPARAADVSAEPC